MRADLRLSMFLIAGLVWPSLAGPARAEPPTSFVAAFLVPLKGGAQALGSDATWGQFMISTSIRF